MSFATDCEKSWEDREGLDREEVEDDNADVAEAPAPTPGPIPRPKPTPKIIAIEDSEMSDIPKKGVAIGKHSQMVSDSEEDPVATENPAMLGEKRALQDSPSHAESIAKCVRTVSSCVGCR